MKVEKDMWARIESFDRFGVIETVYENGEVGLKFKITDNSSKGYYYYYSYFRVDVGNIVATADDPRELVMRHDLVDTLQTSTGKVQKVVRCTEDRSFIEILERRAYTYVDVPEITKILTPNGNGGYDLAWEEEDADNNNKKWT